MNSLNTDLGHVNNPNKFQWSDMRNPYFPGMYYQLSTVGNNPALVPQPSDLQFGGGPNSSSTNGGYFTNNVTQINENSSSNNNPLLAPQYSFQYSDNQGLGEGSLGVTNGANNWSSNTPHNPVGSNMGSQTQPHSQIHSRNNPHQHPIHSQPSHHSSAQNNPNMEANSAHFLMQSHVAAAAAVNHTPSMFYPYGYNAVAGHGPSGQPPGNMFWTTAATAPTQQATSSGANIDITQHHPTWTETANASSVQQHSNHNHKSHNNNNNNNNGSPNNNSSNGSSGILGDLTGHHPQFDLTFPHHQINTGSGQHLHHHQHHHSTVLSDHSQVASRDHLASLLNQHHHPHNPYASLAGGHHNSPYNLDSAATNQSSNNSVDYLQMQLSKQLLMNNNIAAATTPTPCGGTSSNPLSSAVAPPAGAVVNSNSASQLRSASHQHNNNTGNSNSNSTNKHSTNNAAVEYCWIAESNTNPAGINVANTANNNISRSNMTQNQKSSYAKVAKVQQNNMVNNTASSSHRNQTNNNNNQQSDSYYGNNDNSSSSNNKPSTNNNNNHHSNNNSRPSNNNKSMSTTNGFSTNNKSSSNSNSSNNWFGNSVSNQHQHHNNKYNNNSTNNWKQPMKWGGIVPTSTNAVVSGDSDVSSGSKWNATVKSEEVLRGAEVRIKEIRAQINQPQLDINYEKTRYFVIKSYSEDDVHRSIKYKVWCSTKEGNKRLNEAYMDSKRQKGHVLLLFSVNGSGHFCGVAEMVSPVDFNASLTRVWSQDNKWRGKFSVHWLYVKDVPNTQLRHIMTRVTRPHNTGGSGGDDSCNSPSTEIKPITNVRDATELVSSNSTNSEQAVTGSSSTTSSSVSAGYKDQPGYQALKIIMESRSHMSIFDDFIYYEKREHQIES